MAEYIDKEKAKKVLIDDYAYAAATLLDEVPVEDVTEVRHGYWFKSYGGGSKYGCSACFTQADLSKQHKNYCSNCGAKMDKE